MVHIIPHRALSKKKIYIYIYIPHRVEFDSVLKPRRTLSLASCTTPRDASPSTVHGGSGTKQLPDVAADEAPSTASPSCLNQV